MRCLVLQRLFISWAMLSALLMVVVLPSLLHGSVAEATGLPNRDERRRVPPKRTPQQSTSASSEAGGGPNSQPMARSVIVDNHQPLVDERIMLDSSVRHHLSFISPDSLSEFVVDDISAEVATLRKSLPSFDKICGELEGPDVDSEDGLLRCLKRLYFPKHPIYTGRFGATPASLMGNGGGRSSPPLQIGSDGAATAADFADGIGEASGGTATAADTDALTELDESLLMDTDGWLPQQLNNGSIYLCRMPRAGDRQLVENDNGDIVPKQVGEKKTKAANEGSDAADADKNDEDGEADDPKTFDQLQPGQKLPIKLRRELSNRMKGLCITKPTGGWWSYEVCWEKHVRQFHKDGEKETSHFLGQGPKKRIPYGSKIDDVYFNVHSVRGPYLSATFKNGSTCDVTGQPRIAEIRLYCEEEAAASSKAAAAMGLPEMAGITVVNPGSSVEISEPETCTYLVWMGHPKACMKQIRKRQGPIFGVRCRNVDDL